MYMYIFIDVRTYNERAKFNAGMCMRVHACSWVCVRA